MLPGTQSADVRQYPLYWQINDALNGALLNLVVGTAVGRLEGLHTGGVDGLVTGSIDGTAERILEGEAEGIFVKEGLVDGPLVGAFDIAAEGFAFGEIVCRNDGFVDGDTAGLIDEGAPLGTFVLADCGANPLG